MKQTTLNRLLNFWTLFIGIGAVWGSHAVCACGVILMLWISLEWWVFGFSWLPNLYFAFGILEACTALIYIKAL